MTADLLIKEKEFHRMNKELEQKAHDLMNKINHVIKSYGTKYSAASTCNKEQIAIKKEEDNSKNIKLPSRDISSSSITRNSSVPYTSDPILNSQSKHVESGNENKHDVSRKGNLTNEMVIDVFRTKIHALLKELQEIQTEYQKKCDVCKNLETENKKCKIKYQTETESLKDTIAKLENTLKEAQCQSNLLISENLALKKDLSKLQKQLNLVSQESNGYLVRLNRSLANNDKLKNTLKLCDIKEKELKAEINKLEESRTVSIQNLGKQLSEAVKVLKNQALLVDNLKKQNACLAAVGQVKLIKEDFLRLLEKEPVIIS